MERKGISGLKKKQKTKGKQIQKFFKYIYFFLGGGGVSWRKKW